MLAGVAAALHEGVQARPLQHVHGLVGVVHVQVADDLHVQRVGLLLVVGDLNDQLLEVLRLLEVAEILHGGVHGLARLADEGGEAQGVLGNLMDVEHVEVLQHVLDLIQNLVQRAGQSHDVLAIERRHEVVADVLVDVVVDHVAGVLERMGLIEHRAQGSGIGEVLHGAHKDARLLHGQIGQLFVGVEVIVLVFLGHWTSLLALQDHKE